MLSSGRDFFLDFWGSARGAGIRAACLIALGALLEGVGLALLVPMLGLLIKNDAADRVETLAALLAGFALLVLLRAVVLWRRDVILAELRIGFVEGQRTRLVGRLVGAGWPTLSRIPHARINHLLSSDIAMAGSCVHFMLQGGVALGMLAAQWLLALLLMPVLALLIGALLLVASLALVPQLAKSRDLGRDVAEANLQLATCGSQFLGGLKLAISQNLQSRFADEFNATLNRLMSRQVACVREHSKSQLAFASLSSLAGAAAILIGTWRFDMTPAALIVFVLVLARMSAPAALLQQCAQQCANFLPSYEKIRALEAELQSEPAAIADIEPPSFGAIRFSKVSFRHPGGDKGVFDLDLTIEPGSFTGITGASGAGKTTFADLLVGLLEPQSGTIAVGGRVMTKTMRSHWRSLVAYAPQDAFLFHDSVRNNLLWADPAASDEDLRAVLRLAEADGIAGDLDKIVGETGALLSGGERQRLTLARALLRRAPLLILDEATSAIDISTERDLLGTLSALPWRPAILLIAHRGESLACCDRIIELAEGRIVGDRRAVGDARRRGQFELPHKARASAAP